MSKQEQFQTIVNTILSNPAIDERILRAHVQQYAQSVGVPYTLAAQAVILAVKDRLLKQINKL